MTRVVIDEEARRVITTFDDGTEVVAAPLYDEESIARARSLGYAEALGYVDAFTDYSNRYVVEPLAWAACRDHDRLHTLLAEAQGYPVSLALWYAAHPDQKPRSADKLMAAIEERTVLLVQRLLNEGLERLWQEREDALPTEEEAA